MIPIQVGSCYLVIRTDQRRIEDGWAEWLAFSCSAVYPIQKTNFPVTVGIRKGVWKFRSEIQCTNCVSDSVNIKVSDVVVGISEAKLNMLRMLLP